MTMDRRGRKVDRVDCSFMWDLNRGIFKVLRKPTLDSAGMKTKIFFRTVKQIGPQVLYVFLGFLKLKL